MIKKVITVVLEVESDDDYMMTDDFIKKDLEQEINCASNSYSVVSITTVGHEADERWNNVYVLAVNPDRVCAVRTDYRVWGGNGPELYGIYKEALERKRSYEYGDVIPFNNSSLYLCKAKSAGEAIDKYWAKQNEDYTRRHYR